MSEKWYEDRKICPGCGSVMKFISDTYQVEGKERIEAICTGCGEEWTLLEQSRRKKND